MARKAAAPIRISVHLTVEVNPDDWNGEYGTLGSPDAETAADIRAAVRNTAFEATQDAMRHLPVVVTVHGL